MTALVVMFPDFRGEGLFGNFGESLIQLENLPKETVFVPILNGDAQSSLLLKANRAREKGFKPVISLAKGASAAIIAGYQMVATKYPEAIIVRLDTAEHNINYIYDLGKKAFEIGGMVIGDLQFSQETLIKGTPDWFVHQKIFPIMYELFTEGDLRLSCAHGFNAFAPGITLAILRKAIKMIKLAEQEAGTQLMWGADTAMALAAYWLGIPIDIVPVPAQTLRNRDPYKIASQFADTLRICKTSLTVFRRV